MKIVLDNNVFISGIFWKGPPNKIIKLAEQNKIQIFSTYEILRELFGVLQRDKFKPYFQEAGTEPEEAFDSILKLVKTCSPAIEVDLIKEDPDDNKILDCAVSCGASFMVSGDRHLLHLKEFQNIPILTPRKFLKHID